jgi:hypothetical protein
VLATHRRFIVGITLTFLGACGCSGNSASNEVLSAAASEEANERLVDPSVVLDQVVELIRLAPENPGGSNFDMAASSLNDFFLGTAPEEFAVPKELESFLAKQPLPPNALSNIKRSKFHPQFDGRHLEDCLLLRGVALGILGRGKPPENDLEKARRLFDWVVRNIQLVPQGMLAPPRMAMPDGTPKQPPARPYDVLVRGLASEDGTDCADRSWLFLALCRQAGLDACYLAVTDPRARTAPRDVERKDPAIVPFASGVLADGQIYLFDLRHGLVIPTADGKGVATLNQVIDNPTLLTALDAPGHRYPFRPEILNGGKIRVLLDATVGSLATRMKLLQDRLSGDDRMTLYSDPSAQAKRFAEAVGGHIDDVYLWTLPLNVEYLLFYEDSFNRATGFSLQPFGAEWPLLSARLMQLRGKLDDAIKAYVVFRRADEVFDSTGKPLTPQVQQILDIYATQFLALAQLDVGRVDDARFLFTETLRVLPEPTPGVPYFTAFRWGANHNLARIHDSRGESTLAVRYYTQTDPTDESLASQLRVQSLVWSDPFVPDPQIPVPPSPPRLPPSVRTAAPSS